MSNKCIRLEGKEACDFTYVSKNLNVELSGNMYAVLLDTF